MLFQGENFTGLLKPASRQKKWYMPVSAKPKMRFGLRSRARFLCLTSNLRIQLLEIDRIAGKMKVKAPVALRINPDIDTMTHPYISTGLRKHKFGIPMENALECYKLALGLRNVSVVGIHKHIGSQLTKVLPFVDALKRILTLMDELIKQGIGIEYLDIGGGLGITYYDETPPTPAQLARNILPLLKDRKLTLILEPAGLSSAMRAFLLLKHFISKKGKIRILSLSMRE